MIIQLRDPVSILGKTLKFWNSIYKICMMELWQRGAD